MSNDSPYPKRTTWPILWLSAFVASIWLLGNERAELLTRCLLVGGLWLGLWVWRKASEPHWAPITEPPVGDPLMRGALLGGFVALLTTSIVGWLLPALTHATRLGDDEGGGPSVSSIIAMLAVYMVSRAQRIDELQNGRRSHE